MTSTYRHKRNCKNVTSTRTKYNKGHKWMEVTGVMECGKSWYTVGFILTLLDTLRFSPILIKQCGTCSDMGLVFALTVLEYILGVWLSQGCIIICFSCSMQSSFAKTGYFRTVSLKYLFASLWLSCWQKNAEQVFFLFGGELAICPPDFRMLKGLEM